MQGILFYTFLIYLYGQLLATLAVKCGLQCTIACQKRTYIIMLLCVHVSWKWKCILAKVLNCLHDILLMLEQTGHF